MRQLFRSNLAATAAVVLSAFGCAPALPAPNAAHLASAQKTDARTTLADLQRGRSLYAGKCGNCHALREPSSVSPEDWPEEVEEMRSEQNVRLSPEETQDILRYLTAVSQVSNP